MITEAEKQIGREIFAKVKGKLDYLQARWQDEREYEDFQEYKDSMKKSVQEAGGEFRSLDKRFNLVFTVALFPKMAYKAKCTATKLMFYMSKSN